MINQLVVRVAKDLKQASIKINAPIWAKLAKLALKPNSVKRTINLKRIDELTKENERILTVESTGALSPEQIIISGIAELSNRLVEFKDLLGKLKI